MPVESAAQTKKVGARSRSKLFLALILGLAMISLAGGSFFAYSEFLERQEAYSAAGQKTEPIGQQKTIGEIYALEPFVVNLSDPRGKRYLKVQIELELASSRAVVRAAQANPKLRDMVIMMLTSLTFEDVITPEGKIRVRDELLQRFNQLMRPDRVINIYFTEFVIQ